MIANKSEVAFPKLPARMLLPLDVGGIATALILGMGFWILASWQGALSALIASLASWLHLRLLITSFNRFGIGGIAFHLLWMAVRFFILAGIIIGILLLLQDSALAVALGVALTTTTACFGLLFSLRRLKLNQT